MHCVITTEDNWPSDLSVPGIVSISAPGEHAISRYTDSGKESVHSVVAEVSIRAEINHAQVIFHWITLSGDDRGQKKRKKKKEVDQGTGGERWRCKGGTKLGKN